ncbi:MAG TPA: amidohydrolase family protein [Dehalococcoidia bacterium]|nr:amidohydrolase family protein [Dehalococcoidia bacterium]
MNQELCISSDSHVVETPDIFDGLDQRFGDLAPRIVHEPGKGDILHVNGRSGLNIGRFGIAGHFANDPETLAMMKEGYKGLRKSIVDPHERVRDQELDGLDAEVLLPSVMFGIYPVNNAEIVSATFKNFNDWIMNYTSQAPNRLFPTACLSLLDIDEAIQELHRVKNLGHVGANIPCIPPVDRPYTDREYYEPFWAAAQELEMPLVMHVNCSAQPNHGLPDWGPVMSYCLWPTGMAKVIGDLIWGGVCARYPKLKFVATEWETGWIAQFLSRLDWSIHRVPSHIIPPEVTMTGTEYFHQNFTVTFEDDRVGILTREMIGVKNMMWGSDFPHHDSTFPRSQDVLDEIFEDVPAEERYRITVANVCELYGLPIEY